MQKFKIQKYTILKNIYTIYKKIQIYIFIYTYKYKKIPKIYKNTTNNKFLFLKKKCIYTQIYTQKYKKTQQEQKRSNFLITKK